MQDASHLAPVADGLGEKPVEQAEQSFAGAVKDVCSGLQAKVVELDFSMSCAENFMLGESVTSFYLPRAGCGSVGD